MSTTENVVSLNPRAVVGGNNPPGPVDDSRNIYRTVQVFLQRNPTVADEAAARSANDILATADTTIKALETGRSDECDPLRKIWEQAREKWRPAIEAMTTVRSELASRLAVYMRAEEDRRKAEAAEAKRIAEALALAAERRNGWKRKPGRTPVSANSSMWSRLPKRLTKFSTNINKPSEKPR